MLNYDFEFSIVADFEPVRVHISSSYDRCLDDSEVGRVNCFMGNAIAAHLGEVVASDRGLIHIASEVLPEVEGTFKVHGNHVYRHSIG